MTKLIISYAQLSHNIPARVGRALMDHFKLSYEELKQVKCDLHKWGDYEDLLKDKVLNPLFSPVDRQHFIQNACLALANHKGAILILPCDSIIDHLFREEIKKLAPRFELELLVWSGDSLVPA